MAKTIKINTQFGEVGIRYAMIDNGFNHLDEGYDVYNDEGVHLGSIFIDLDTELLDKEFDSDIDKDELNKLEEAIAMFF